MSTQQYLIEFLKAVEAAVPPPVGCRHALTLSTYGRQDDWKYGLALQVNRGGLFTCLFLGESDLEKSPADLALAVVSCLAAL